MSGENAERRWLRSEVIDLIHDQLPVVEAYGQEIVPDRAIAEQVLVALDEGPGMSAYMVRAHWTRDVARQVVVALRNRLATPDDVGAVGIVESTLDAYLWRFDEEATDE
ncbi:MAG: hypothetical protein M0P31_13885 [Solirubrobacteraceae bacterium]|nr:hypothetical protein [Solirubrobacteraceae bacterium]